VPRTLVALMVLTAAAFARGQAPTQNPPRAIGTGQLAGRVTDGASHAPIPDAVVTLGGRASPPQRALVDQDGRFVFSDLPPGTYTLASSHIGYFGSGGSPRDPSPVGRFVDLADGQQTTDLALSLWKLGTIEGAVSADGDPLVGVEVRALRRSLVAGRWQLTAGATATTDDRGRYRLTGLVPGDYAVVVRPDRDPETALLLSVLNATPQSSADVMAAVTARGPGVPERDPRIKTYSTTFFRDAASSSLAALITIDPGKNRAAVDFHLKGTRGVRLAGTVQNLSGPAEGAVVHLIPADSSAESDPLEIAAAACDRDGRFEFSNVVPGKFVVTLLSRPAAPAGGTGSPPPLTTDPTWWARTPVTIGSADIRGVNVHVHEGVAVSGRIEFSGQAARPSANDLAQIAPRLEPVEGLPPGAPAWRGIVLADGRFSTMAVPPGRYFVRVANVPRGWTLVSARLGDRDLLDVPIEVQSAPVSDVVLTFTDHGLGGVNGVVQDAAGSPAFNAVVLVFPATREPRLDTSAQARRFRLIHTTTTGNFSAGGLPDGSYLAIALPEAPAIEWQDAKQLDALAPRASKVDVAIGPPSTVTLTVISK